MTESTTDLFSRAETDRGHATCSALDRAHVRLAAGLTLDKASLRTILEDAFRGPECQGRWDWHLVQDIAEAALARLLATAEALVFSEPAETALSRLEALAARPAPASHRSEDQLRHQQMA